MTITFDTLTENQNDALLNSIKGKCVERGYHIKNLQNKVQKVILVSSKQIIKLGEEAIKEFRIEMGGYSSAYRQTEIKDYTNKKGFKSKAHFIGDKYYGVASKRGKHGDTPKWMLVSVEITEDNFDEDFNIDLTTGLLTPKRK